MFLRATPFCDAASTFLSYPSPLMTRILLPLAFAALLLPSAASAQEEQRVDPIEAALQEWNASHGGDWLLSREVDLPTGRYLHGLVTDPLFLPRSDEGFFELGRMLVDETYGMFGVDSDTLVAERVHDLRLRQIGTTDKVAVEFSQWVRGVPVLDASLHLVFTPRGGLLGLDSRALPGVESLNTRPVSDGYAAVARARAEFAALEGIEAAWTGQPELVILRHHPGKYAEPRLAWAVELRNETLVTDPHGRLMLMAADRGNLELLEARDLIHHQQASGTVQGWATPGTAANSASNPPTLQTMRYMNLTSAAGSTTTDVNGDFTLNVGSANPIDITAAFIGPWARVVNQSGASHTLTQSFTPGVPGSLILNPAKTEYATSEASCFDSVVDMREWLKSIDPGDNHLDFQVLTNANLPQTCNAYFNGSSINMYRAGGGCNNTGFSTVVVHEEGHWANVIYGSGNGSDGFGEGNADVFAMYVYDTPLVGEGFYTSGGNIRSGWNTRQFCGNSNPGCYGEVHADGEVLMGALWKVRNNLNLSLGNAAGDLVADTLMVAWMNAYTDGQIRTFIEDHWLTLDDNDGNIYNGTPNFGDIDGGFRAQGFPGVTLQLLEVLHTPLADTLDEQGPYLVSADVASLVGSVITSVEMTWSVDGGITTTVPMVNTVGDTYEASIPGQPSPANVSYRLEATDSLGNTLADPATGEHTFLVGIRDTLYFNNFDGTGDEGWTHAQVATQDDWQRGTPQGKVEDPSAAYSGARCWGNDLGGSGFNGAYQPNVNNHLDSPSIDCSGATGVHLRFRRWLSVETAVYDHAEIFVNGNLVWQNPNTGNLVDTAWQPIDLDISQWADGNPAVTVRFQLRSDGGLQFGGWNIDDFELYRLQSSSGSQDLLTLNGPTVGLPGSSLLFSVSGMEPGAPWWLAGGTSIAGSVVQGHVFDLGAPYQILGSGTADFLGNASKLVAVPSAASGLTVYVEAASTISGYLVDSNPLTIAIQ